MVVFPWLRTALAVCWCSLSSDSTSCRTSRVLTALPFENEINHNQIVSSQEDPLLCALREMDFSGAQQDNILTELSKVGLWNTETLCSRDLLAVSRDFVDAPMELSQVLRRDFGLPVLISHQARAMILYALRSQKDPKLTPTEDSLSTQSSRVSLQRANKSQLTEPTPLESNPQETALTPSAPKRQLFKQVVVNEMSQKRHRKDHTYDYGLPRDYATVFPTLGAELDAFFTFMTKPSILSSEPPLRVVTANVYLRHAKLFLGWYVNIYQCQGELDPSMEPKFGTTDPSLYNIIPNQEKNSATCFIDFLLWLRSNRQISVSYEANVLRGITKMLKFRFARDCSPDRAGDPSKPFDDVPILRELRKLHRQANGQQRLAPRVSDETKKWLSWPEYLGVVQQSLTEVDQLLRAYNGPDPETVEASFTVEQRRISVAYQKYLILAIFASIPDRQRTIRELELDRSFVKDIASDSWGIKHAPDDYKTGKTYGERPLLQLSPSLTPAIEGFVSHWRLCLRPQTKHVFVQPRTCNPLTQDSVYQIVSRACFQYTGKRTNPHLLRDMIVTHVRESDASEKQLEALALFMGHSIQVQRASYDRRTLNDKVAPAVELIRSLNSVSLIK